MKIISVLLLLFNAISIFAQQATTAALYAATIESQTLKDHVYKLASPEFEGRETGKQGNRLAAQYIADQFSSDGIPPIPGDGDYFQDVAFSKIRWDYVVLKVNGVTMEHLKDYLSIPQYFPEGIDSFQINSLTFLGYGIDDPAYSDYGGKNVKGLNLVIYDGEPKDNNGNFRISGNNAPSDWSLNQMKKIAVAKAAGAASIWIIEEKLKDHVLDTRKNLVGIGMIMGSPESLSAPYIPYAFISTSLADQLLAKKKSKVTNLRNKITETGKSNQLAIPVDINWKAKHWINFMEGENVLGYIEGTDSLLKNELVIISAHYDHLGKHEKDIFYGADDNASGTSAVLEIAQAMELAKEKGDGPRRSVLCMLVTGEEKGLLGSQYYSQYPVFPLANTVADVNIDMIGRMDTLHKQPNYTYVIGSNRLSTELHQINESVNQQYTHLDLDYTYNRDDDPNRFYYRSDHYNFAKNGIPSIFYFSGVHVDYHRPTDTPDKIMYDKARTIAQLAFHTAWELANRDQRIKVDVTGRN